jgi:hypothetical protein
MDRIDPMPFRDVDLNETGDLVLRSRPDWLFPIFFGMLGGLHGTIATIAFVHGRWEGYLSAGFCVIFISVAAACRRFRTEMSVLRIEKQIRLRIGIGRLGVDRRIAFGAISGVRLTLLNGRGPECNLIELICYDDDLRCPPTKSPRHEALLLAMILDVPLTKVYGEHVLPDRERVDVLQ